MPHRTSRSFATPPARLGRRERRRRETRERLFRAALRLFAERGFTATTVEDITEAADVGKGTFFNYFSAKEHVLDMMGEIQRGKVEQAAAAARTGDESVRKVLTRLSCALAEEPGRSPALFRSLAIAVQSSEGARSILAKNLELGRKSLAELMVIGQHRGEVRRDRDPGELARIFQQSFFGALMLWSIHPPSKLADRLGNAMEVFWSGISAAPTHEKRHKEKTP